MTSSTRPASSTAPGWATRTSCSGRGRTAPPPRSPGATRSWTPSSPGPPRVRPCSRSARTWTSSSAIQGAPPELVRVALGGSKREVQSFRTDDLMAYYRRAKADFLAHVEAEDPVYPPADSYPDPVEHCQVCRWALVCRDRRRADDDLSLVAGIAGRTRRELKGDRGLATRRSLAGLELPLAPGLARTGEDALRRVRDQAAIQVRGEDSRSAAARAAPAAGTDPGRRPGHHEGPARPAPAPSGRPLPGPGRGPIRVRRRYRLPVRHPGGAPRLAGRSSAASGLGTRTAG